MAVFPPPPVNGLGQVGGFKLELEDRAGLGETALNDATQALLGQGLPDAGSSPGLFSSYRINVPQLEVEVDREKVKREGISLTDLFQTMQVYLGSVYVNDFNRFGRTYQVKVQADAQFRATAENIAQLKVRNAAGRDGAARLRGPGQGDRTGPTRSLRYNGYPAADINGGPAPGFSSGQAEAAIEALAAGVLPQRHRLRVDRSQLPAAAGRQHGDLRLPALRAARVPGARGAVRELVAAARGHPDRADVPALRHHRRVAHARATTTSSPRSGSWC